MSAWQYLVQLDHELFAYLNGKHVDWLDQLMYYISSDWFWIPFYLILIYLLFKKFKKRTWLPLLFVILGVLISDQVSNRIKKATRRPRPSHNEAFSHTIHTVNNYRGGQYGFISSHAANTFCVATMMAFLLSLGWVKGLGLFLWASLVSYSRIYLGVHFPADIVGGAFLGTTVAFILIFIEKKSEKSLFYKA